MLCDSLVCVGRLYEDVAGLQVVAAATGQCQAELGPGKRLQDGPAGLLCHLTRCTHLVYHHLQSSQPQQIICIHNTRAVGLGEKLKAAEKFIHDYANYLMYNYMYTSDPHIFLCTFAYH